MAARGTGHGPCPYEADILSLWDAGHSRQQIKRMTRHSPAKIDQALGLNEDGAHRRHVAAMKASNSAFLAALQAAR